MGFDGNGVHDRGCCRGQNRRESSNQHELSLHSIDIQKSEGRVISFVNSCTQTGNFDCLAPVGIVEWLARVILQMTMVRTGLPLHMSLRTGHVFVHHALRRLLLRHLSLFQFLMSLRWLITEKSKTLIRKTVVMREFVNSMSKQVSSLANELTLAAANQLEELQSKNDERFSALHSQITALAEEQTTLSADRLDIDATINNPCATTCMSSSRWRRQ